MMPSSIVRLSALRGIFFKVACVATAFLGLQERAAAHLRSVACDHHCSSTHDHDHGVSWLTGENVHIGNILFPSMYLRVAGGAADGASAGELAAGAHDPSSDGISLQGLELRLDLRAGDHLDGMFSVDIFTDSEDELDAELDEAFLLLHSLPGGFEVRGGRMLNRFGFTNSLHLHYWDFVDLDLAYGRILGPERLRMTGGEITWALPAESFASAISLGAGVAVEHDHHHGGGGHHHADHGEFEGEAALYDDFLLTASWVTRFPLSANRQMSTVLSYGYGDNELGRHTQIGGLGVEFLWRRNGIDTSGGRFLRWRNEVFYRNIAARLDGEESHSSHGHGHGHDHGHGHGSDRERFEDVALVSALVAGLNDRVDAGLRGEWVSGIREAEDLAERYRVSGNLTYWLNEARMSFLRLQYNFDHSSDFGDAHSLWAQFGFDWGKHHVH